MSHDIETMNEKHYVKNVSNERWSELSGVKPASRKCMKCGRYTNVSIPIAFDDFRGFISPVHPNCGARFQICTVTSSDPKTNELFKSFFNFVQTGAIS